MSLFSVIVVPPAMLVLRKLIKRIKTIAQQQFTGTTRILETLQETVQGIRIVKAFTLEDDMRARFDAHVAELEQRIEQVGARRLSLQPADGGARRLRDRGRPDLWRLSRDRDRGDARSVLLLPRRLHAGLRAGQAPGTPQHRPQQRPGRRAHPVRRHRPSADRGAGRRQAAAHALDRARRVRQRAVRLPSGRAGDPTPVASSPSPARSPRWSVRPAAASRPSST